MVLICAMHCGTATMSSTMALTCTRKMQGTIKPLFVQAHWILILATSGFCYLVGRCELLLVGYLIRTGSELLPRVTTRFAPSQSRIRPQHKVVSHPTRTGYRWNNRHYRSDRYDFAVWWSLRATWWLNTPTLYPFGFNSSSNGLWARAQPLSHRVWSWGVHFWSTVIIFEQK